LACFGVDTKIDTKMDTRNLKYVADFQGSDLK